MRTLTRKQIKEGLEQVPMTELLGVSGKALTGKQKEFAKGLALGKTKADAYRQSHKKDATRATITTEPYKLAADPRIALEVEAYRLAIEASKHRTPAALRELVIQSLVQVVIDPEAKQATKVQAAKVLGTVTEVAAFTERKEIRTITSSEDTKAKIMGQLRDMLKAGAEDATVIEADTLLRELAGDTHPSPTPPTSQSESQSLLHTIPHERSELESESAAESEGGTPLENLEDIDPTPSSEEDPPLETRKDF